MKINHISPITQHIVDNIIENGGFDDLDSFDCFFKSQISIQSGENEKLFKSIFKSINNLVTQKHPAFNKSVYKTLTIITDKFHDYKEKECDVSYKIAKQNNHLDNKTLRYIISLNTFLNQNMFLKEINELIKSTKVNLKDNIKSSPLYPFRNKRLSHSSLCINAIQDTIIENLPSKININHFRLQMENLLGYYNLGMNILNGDPVRLGRALRSMNLSSQKNMDGRLLKFVYYDLMGPGYKPPAIKNHQEKVKLQKIKSLSKKMHKQISPANNINKKRKF